MASELPENYTFQFIYDAPTDWENTLVFHAQMSGFVTIVRQFASK